MAMMPQTLIMNPLMLLRVNVRPRPLNLGPAHGTSLVTTRRHVDWRRLATELVLPLRFPHILFRIHPPNYSIEVLTEQLSPQLSPESNQTV